MVLNTSAPLWEPCFWPAHQKHPINELSSAVPKGMFASVRYQGKHQDPGKWISGTGIYDTLVGVIKMDAPLWKQGGLPRGPSM